MPTMTTDALQDLAVQTLNVSLMLSVGLELDLAELRAALRRRRLLIGVTAINFVLIPAIAFGLSRLLGLEGGLAAGLLLCAFAPGGGTGTLLTRVARGNLELSVVLLAIFTVLAVPITPALTTAALAGTEAGSISLAPMLGTLMTFQLTPLVAGLALQTKNRPYADRLNAVARPFSTFVFVALVGGLIATKIHLMPKVSAEGLVAITAVVLTSLIGSAMVPTPSRDRAAIVLTSAVRNLALALLLSTSFFDAMTTLAVLAYGLIMYLITVPLAMRWRRAKSTRSAPKPRP